MDDFAPPTGPPPPKAPDVPAGWAARWNDQYKEWFYVNVYTKKSQWEKPTAPVFPVDENAPEGPPPGYAPGDGPVPTDTKKNPYDDQRNQTIGGSSTEEDDAKLAARLQAEEDARARGGFGGPDVPAGYGGSSSPYPQNNSPYPPSNSPYPQQSGSPYPSELPPRDKGKSGGGFLGKLLGKGKQLASNHQSGSHGGGYGGGYQQQQQQYYGQQQGYPGQGPPMGYGGQPHYGQGYGAPGGYGGYGGGHGYGSHGGGFGGHSGGRKPGGGGMGMMGGAALGAGAGLIGGALIADAVMDNDQDAYQDGFQDGADFGDDGGDFGD
ncbi:rna-binding fus tls [Fusarium albosuccineum]|uniref:Rna-binding fus tls n=1 Tax=Fusarium albosuccineum TaxID=1237068 RepID=A0A8H4P473_9HYPO|nr:rna-binding fus tls [Fusarium albosuccineum]